MSWHKYWELRCDECLEVIGHYSKRLNRNPRYICEDCKAKRLWAEEMMKEGEVFEEELSK